MQLRAGGCDSVNTHPFLISQRLLVSNVRLFEIVMSMSCVVKFSIQSFRCVCRVVDTLLVHTIGIQIKIY